MGALPRVFRWTRPMGGCPLQQDEKPYRCFASLCSGAPHSDFRSRSPVRNFLLIPLRYTIKGPFDPLERPPLPHLFWRFPVQLLFLIADPSCRQWRPTADAKRRGFEFFRLTILSKSHLRRPLFRSDYPPTPSNFFPTRLPPCLPGGGRSFRRRYTPGVPAVMTLTRNLYFLPVIGRWSRVLG